MMKHDLLSDAVTAVDTDILEHYETYRAAHRPRTQMKSRRFFTLGAVAACAALVTVGGVWYATSRQAPTHNTADVVTVYYTEVGDYLAAYTMVTDLSQSEVAALEGNIGELYESTDFCTLYRVKGEDDLASLICRDHGAEQNLYLLRFTEFVPFIPGDEETYTLPSAEEEWTLIHGAETAAAADLP